MINIPNAQTITIETENGIGRKVFVDDFELHGVTDVDISYGIDNLPKVKIEMYALRVEGREVAEDDKRSGQNP